MDTYQIIKYEYQYTKNLSLTYPVTSLDLIYLLAPMSKMAYCFSFHDNLECVMA